MEACDIRFCGKINGAFDGGVESIHGDRIAPVDEVHMRCLEPN
jgi:hypothetical protein